MYCRHLSILEKNKSIGLRSKIASKYFWGLYDFWLPWFGVLSYFSSSSKDILGVGVRQLAHLPLIFDVTIVLNTSIKTMVSVSFWVVQNGEFQQTALIVPR